jgi:hypothetical protein
MLLGSNRTMAGIAAALSLCAGTAGADVTTVDSSYGRIEGDIDAIVGIGAVVAPRGPRGETELRLRYLETAGVVVTYEDALGSSAEPERVLTTGLELRPLFLARWLRGEETQRAWLDLTLDSIGFEMGAVFQQASARGFASQRGIEVALGIELPLLARATGPWIGVRGGLRWSEAALASGSVLGADDRQVILAVTLAWHQIFAAHVVDVGDRAVH